MSKVEERVIQKIRNRAAVGKKKYGVTMERDDLDLDEWMQHLQDELMDATVYLQKIMEEVRDLNEEIDLKNYDEDAIEDRMKHIGQNGNTGEHYDSTMYPGDIKITYDIVKP